MNAMNTSTSTNRVRLMGMAAAILFVSVSMTSCTTEEPDEPDNTTTENPTPTIEDGYGTLTAVRSVTIQDVPIVGPTEIPLNIAAAAFFDGTDYTTFQSAGSLTCEGEDLTMNANNSYTLTPGTNNPSGMDIDGSIDWTVSGNGVIPAFNHTVGISFPSVGAINSSTTVTKADGYTLSVANLSGADSVIFMVNGVLFTEPGNPTSRAFTAAELTDAGSGPGVVQVAAYKIESAEYDGKTFYFVNERVSTLSVTVE